MSEMLERVARRLCGPRADEMVIPQRVMSIGPKGFPFAGPDPVPAWHMFRSDAYAAIAAMREPSDAMAEAGLQHTGDPCWQDNVKGAWRAMIDEALK